MSSSNISRNMDNLSQTDPALQLNEVERKKSMNEFNQIYKQIPNEKERRKFLVQNALILSKDHAGCRKL